MLNPFLPLTFKILYGVGSRLSSEGGYLFKNIVMSSQTSRVFDEFHSVAVIIFIVPSWQLGASSKCLPSCST